MITTDWRLDRKQRVVPRLRPSPSAAMPVPTLDRMEVRQSLRRYEDLVQGCLAVAGDLNKEVSSLSQTVSDVRVALANMMVFGETIDNATVDTTISSSCANSLTEDRTASWTNGTERLLGPAKVEAIMVEPAIGNPRLPRITTVVFLICATGLLFGLGLVVEGHEWHQQPAGSRPGIFLIVAAILVAIFTSFIHAAFCMGWRNRSRSVTSSH